MSTCQKLSLTTYAVKVKEIIQSIIINNFSIVRSHIKICLTDI